jgi:hypothetical protein
MLHPGHFLLFLRLFSHEIRLALLDQGVSIPPLKKCFSWGKLEGKHISIFSACVN